VQRARRVPPAFVPPPADPPSTKLAFEPSLNDVTTTGHDKHPGIVQVHVCIFWEGHHHCLAGSPTAAAAASLRCLSYGTECIHGISRVPRMVVFWLLQNGIEAALCGKLAGVG
jgi:hypothetical protein